MIYVATEAQYAEKPNAEKNCLKTALAKVISTEIDYEL